MLARDRRRLILPFLAPFLVLQTVLFAWPVVQSLPISLMNFTGIGDNMQFVGLANYAELVGDSEFQQVVVTTFRFAIFGGLLTLPVALYFAVILNQDLPLRKVLKLVVFAPTLISVVAASLLWIEIFDPSVGLLSNGLTALGLSSWNHAWLGEPGTAFWAVIVAMLWQGIGTYVILFLAALQTLPREFYDAARIDGAGAWRCFVNVTFPLIWDVTRILILLYVIGGLQAFTWQFILTRGGPYSTTEVMGMYLYEKAFQMSRFGYATAVGVVMLVLIMGLTITMNKALTREIVEY